MQSIAQEKFHGKDKLKWRPDDGVFRKISQILLI
jgi:hypothetical protein